MHGGMHVTIAINHAASASVYIHSTVDYLLIKDSSPFSESEGNLAS